MKNEYLNECDIIWAKKEESIRSQLSSDNPGKYIAVMVIVKRDSGIPQMVFENLEGNQVFLTPFRTYSFQISGTADGDWDLGSTQVLGLNNILDAVYGTSRKQGYQSNVRLEDMGKAILMELACAAMFHFRSLDDDGRHSYIARTFGCFGKGPLDTFIDETIKWLRTF